MAQPLARLPGADLVKVGLRDLEQGEVTIAALLVSIGATRLRTLGYDVRSPIPDAEHALHEVLATDDPDSAHGRYNALVRQLVSFERTAAARST